jgi:hypothetical protein
MRWSGWGSWRGTWLQNKDLHNSGFLRPRVLDSCLGRNGRMRGIGGSQRIQVMATDMATKL